MSWPAPETLRAILDLPGVSGATRADIEKYLDDPRLHWEMEAGEWMHEASAFMGETMYLKQSLEAAVQSHWSQLLELGKV